MDGTGSEDGTDPEPGLRCTDPTPVHPAWSNERLALLGDSLFFVHRDPATADTQLYRTDGTAAGTERVVETNPGGEDRVDDVGVAGGSLYFVARDGDDPSRKGLWRSDGTASGTTRLLSSADVAGVTGPFTAFGTQVVFTAAGENGFQLWATDGTPAGTREVAAINPAESSVVSGIVELGDAVYFRADAGDGKELWRSDGTTAGTWKVKDINSTTGWGYVSNPVVWNDRLYFFADDGVVGRELWTSDGTEAGTQLVADVTPGPEGGGGQIWPAGDQLFFTVGQLFVTDGSAAGTHQVTNINPEGSPVISAHQFSGGRTVYFGASDELNSGDQLWRTDGTESGTMKIIDPAGPGVETGYSTGVLGFVDGWVYFTAEDGVNGRELWRSDGTLEGSTLIADLLPGEDSSAPREIFALGSAIYFVAEGPAGDTLFRCDLV